MEEIKKLLPKALVRHGITQQVKAATICEAWNYVVPKILPTTIASEIEVISFSRGTIKISVPSPSFSQEIKFKEIELIAKLNTKLEKKR